MHRITSLFIAAVAMAAGAVTVDVVVQEDVYTFVPPNNGSGPLWSFGCTPIVRTGDEVIVSEMETGEGVPLLCNTRWRLLRRTDQGWKPVAEADTYRQREPTSLATTGPGRLFLNVNDSTEPPGTQYGPTKPHVLTFHLGGEQVQPAPLLPQWDGRPYFTDHSYRGYAADPGRGELLMLNIDAKTSVQHACLMNAAGETLATGSISFPIRACYPQVALDNRAVHVMAVGDIVEPVEEWRAFKNEQTGRAWDYVFRILYYAGTPDITKEGFRAPIEIANVDATAGHIGNKDMWVSPQGDVYLMYTTREVQSPLMRDKFFPDKSVVDSLYLVIVRNGEVVERRTLVEGTEANAPGDAKFHATPDGRLYAMLYLTGDGGKNVLLPVTPEPGAPIPIAMPRPLPAFAVASPRAGCEPSTSIDLLGQIGNTMVYTQLRVGFQPNDNVAGFAITHNVMDDGSPNGTTYVQDEAWQVAQYSRSGGVWVEGDTCFLGEGNDMTGITWNGPLPTMNYEVTLEAKRVDGRDFFCGLTFPYGEDPCTLILGGWGGGIVGISSLDGLDASENTTATWYDFQNDRWYAIRLRVTPEKIQAWLDDKPIIDVATEHYRIGIRFEVEPCRPFGIATWRTTGALRNIRLRAFEPGRA
jgi:hypothetical protein